MLKKIGLLFFARVFLQKSTPWLYPLFPCYLSARSVRKLPTTGKICSLGLQEGANLLQQLSLHSIRHGRAADRCDLLRQVFRRDVLKTPLLHDPLALFLEFVAPTALDEPALRVGGS